MIERLADDLHARSLNHAGVDGVPKIHSIESASGIHIRNCCETGSQIDLRVGNCDERTLSSGFSTGIDVHVSVDHARKNRCVAQVNDPRFTWDLDIRADIRDPLASDQHNLIVQQVARFRIEQLSSTDGNQLIGWCEEFTLLRMCGSVQ